jgi:YVTN family beta-propeller protein
MRRSISPLAAALVVVGLAFPPTEQPQDSVLLVTNKSENTISFINPETGEELARVETGPGPHEVAVTPDGSTAFVANYSTNSLTVIDVANRSAQGMIDLGEHQNPHGIVVSKDGKSVWVTTEGSQDLVEVDVESRQVKRAIHTGQRVTHMVALAESHDKAYTANIGSGNVTAIDTKKGEVIEQIRTGDGAEGIAVTPDEKFLLVTNRAAGTFTVIDIATHEIVKSLEVGGFPIRVEVTPDGKRALISQATSATLIEIMTDDWTPGRWLEVGAMPVGIEILPDGKTAIVANTRDDMLTVVDLDSFQAVRTITGGDEPDGMAYVGH